MATLKGSAVVFGAENLTITGVIANANALAYTQSLRHVRDSDVVNVANASGDDASQVFYNLKRKVSISVIPYHGTTTSGARANLASWMPGAGGTLTVVDGIGNADDDYNIMSCSEGRTNTGITTVDLELESRDANDITAAITA